MMGRPKNETVWRHFHRSGGSNEVSCSHCEQRYKFPNVNKMAKHLITCIKCPLLIKQRVQDMLANNVTISKIQTATDSPPSSDLHMHLPSNLAQYNLAKAIFVTGAPLAMVEHPLWKEFFKDLNPHFKTPTRKAISSIYLDKIYNEMSMDITLQLKTANFLHIQCDGWSNIRNEGVVNFLISKPETVFVKSVATQANRHTANYLSQEIIKIMKEYGEQKFFVLIGDNAANMQKAFKIVKEVYPNVVPMGCVAHSLHLICQDFLKCDTLQKNYLDVVNIIKTIKNNKVLTATLAKIVKEKRIGEQLKLPAKTRWGSYFYSMQSVIKTKASLQVLAVHEEVNLQADIKSQLLSEIFWEQLNLSSNIFGCITEWICKLESNEFNIHRVYFAFNEIKSKLELEFASTMILNDAEKTELSTIFNTRFKKTIKPIHLAANLLDPKAQGSDLHPSEEVDAMEFIHTMSQALNITVMADFANYKGRNDFWAKTFVWSCLDEISPVTWWKGICGSTKLSKLAVRILTAPCTSAATERSFSTQSFIHSKKRNRLTTQRAGKITYISCNWNLLFKNSLPPSAEITHSTQFENDMNSSLEGTQDEFPSTSTGITHSTQFENDLNSLLEGTQDDIPSTSTGITHSTRYEFLSDTDSDSDYNYI